jgi:hypothetical protein
MNESAVFFYHDIEIKLKAKNQLLYTKSAYRSWKIKLYK